MKARIPEHGVGRRLLAFGLSEQGKALLDSAAAKHGAETVYTDDGVTPICVLLGEETAEGVPSDSADYPPALGECLLIAGFDREALNGLLVTMREEGLRLPLKAVYTPHNRRWSFAHLMSELAAEHEYMRSRNGK